MVTRTPVTTTVHDRLSLLDAKHAELARAVSRGTPSLRNPQGAVLGIADKLGYPVLTGEGIDSAVTFNPDGLIMITSADGSADRDITMRHIAASGIASALEVHAGSSQMTDSAVTSPAGYFGTSSAAVSADSTGFTAGSSTLTNTAVTIGSSQMDTTGVDCGVGYFTTAGLGGSSSGVSADGTGFTASGSGLNGYGVAGPAATFSTSMAVGSAQVTSGGFQGANFYATAAMYSPVFTVTSRRAHKTAVRPLTDYLGRSALEVVRGLTVCAYRYDAATVPHLADGVDRVGFMADDLETVAPQLLLHDTVRRPPPAAEVPRPGEFVGPLPRAADQTHPEPDPEPEPGPEDDGYNALTMLNVALAAVKELSDQVTALTARVATLEAAAA